MKPQQQTLVTAAGPVQPVLVNQPYQTTSVIGSYRHRQSKVIGALLIIAGSLSIIVGIMAIVFLKDDHAAVTANIGGSGILCGIMIIITGGFGIGAGRRKSRCTITTFLVLAIIGALFSGPEIIRSSTTAFFFHGEPGSILFGMSAVLAAFEFALCLWGSILCCATGGCCCASQSVIYTMPPGEEIIVMTQRPTDDQPPVYPAPPQYPGNRSK